MPARRNTLEVTVTNVKRVVGGRVLVRTQGDDPDTVLTVIVPMADQPKIGDRYTLTVEPDLSGAAWPPPSPS